MSGTRDALPLRSKNARTKAALRKISEQSGVSMTEIAEKAIEHELALLGADEPSDRFGVLATFHRG